MLTREEILDYITQEFTPYASMTEEEREQHLKELIEKCPDWNE